MGIFRQILSLSLFALLSCTGKEEIPSDNGGQDPVVSYDNEFTVRCLLPTEEAYKWEKDVRLSLVEASSGKPAGYAELVNGAGLANALFLIHTNLEEGTEAILYFGDETGKAVARQTSSANDVFPSATVYETAAFALSLRPADMQMTSP